MAHGINWRYATLAALLAFSQALGGCAGLPSQDHKMETNEKESKFGQSMRMATSIRAGGDVTTAARFYQRAHEVDPSRPEPLLGLAELATNAEATDEAYFYYQKAITAAPDNSEMKRSYGTLLLTNGRPELARHVFQDAIRLDDKDYRSFNGLGISLDLLGHQENAQHAYQNGLKAKPGSTTLKNNLALSSAISGNYEEALSTLERLAASAETGPHIRQNLALVYALQGRIDKAVSVAAKDLSRAELKNNVAFYKLLPKLSRKDLAAIVFGIGDVPNAVTDVKKATRTAAKKSKHTRKSRVPASRKEPTAVASNETLARRQPPKSPSANQTVPTNTANRTIVTATQQQPPDSRPAANPAIKTTQTVRDESANAAPSHDELDAPTTSSTDQEREAMLIARTIGRVEPAQVEDDRFPSSLDTTHTLAEPHAIGPEETSVLPFIPTETAESNPAAPETSSQFILGDTQQDQLRVAPALTGLQPSTTPLSGEPDTVIRARLAPDFSSEPGSRSETSATSPSVDTRIGLGFIEPKSFNDPLSRLNSGAGGLLLLELEQRASNTPSRPNDTEPRDSAKPTVKDREQLTLAPAATEQRTLNRDQKPAKAQIRQPPSAQTPSSAAAANVSAPPNPVSTDITADIEESQSRQVIQPSNKKFPASQDEVPDDPPGAASTIKAPTPPVSGPALPPTDHPSESASIGDEDMNGPTASDQPNGPET